MRRHLPKTPLLEEQTGRALLVVLSAPRFEPSLPFYVDLTEKKLPQGKFSRGKRHGACVCGQSDFART